MQLFRSPSHSVPPGGWLGALGASPAPRLGVLALGVLIWADRAPLPEEQPPTLDTQP